MTFTIIALPFAVLVVAAMGVLLYATAVDFFEP